MRRPCGWSVLLAGSALLGWELGCQPGVPATPAAEDRPLLLAGAFDAGPPPRARLSPSVDPH